MWLFAGITVIVLLFNLLFSKCIVFKDRSSLSYTVLLALGVAYLGDVYILICVVLTCLSAKVR